MKKIIILISLLFLSCNKPETPEIVIYEAIKILKNANTISYNVSSISKKAFEEDTIKVNSSFQLKKVEYDPYIGYHFIKKNDQGVNMYYTPVKLFNIKNDEKKVFSYSFKNDASLKVLFDNGKNQESLAGVINVLKDLQKDKTIVFLHEEKINGKLTYVYSASPKKNKDNIVNYFWINPKTYDLVKLKTANVEYKNSFSDFTFYICDFKNIKYNEDMSDEIFTPTYDDSFEVVIDDSDPKKPTILSPGNKAPEWILKDTDGNDIKSDFEGEGKYTFIECWKSTCDHCIKSIPSTKKLVTEFSAKVNFITVNFDKTPEEVKQAIKEHKIDYTVLLANDEFKENYEVQAYPSFFIIDDGNIIYSKYGDLEDFEAEINSVLKSLK